MRFRKHKRLTDNILVKKDNVGELKNDRNYADYEKVKSIIAEVVTADYIQAQNAKFSNAQIEQLIAGDVQINGSINVKEAMTASKVKVTDPATGDTLFEADGSKKDRVVNIAGWKVNPEELDAPNNKVALYSGNTKKYRSPKSGNEIPIRFMAGGNNSSDARIMILNDGTIVANKTQSDSRVNQECWWYLSDLLETHYFVGTHYQEGTGNYPIIILLQVFEADNKLWALCLKTTSDPQGSIDAGTGLKCWNTSKYSVQIYDAEDLFNHYVFTSSTHNIWP